MENPLFCHPNDNGDNNHGGDYHDPTTAAAAAVEENDAEHMSGRSPLALYLEYQRDAMEKIYSSTVDGPCSNSCDKQMEMMHCQQFLTFLGDSKQRGGAGGGAGGATTTKQKQTCEYCGVTAAACLESCKRPTLFFLKKKPPFATNHEEWDPITEYPLQSSSSSPILKSKGPQPSDPNSTENATATATTTTATTTATAATPSSGGSSWMPDFFSSKTTTTT